MILSCRLCCHFALLSLDALPVWLKDGKSTFYKITFFNKCLHGWSNIYYWWKLMFNVIEIRNEIYFCWIGCLFFQPNISLFLYFIHKSSSGFWWRTCEVYQLSIAAMALMFQRLGFHILRTNLKSTFQTTRTAQSLVSHSEASLIVSGMILIPSFQMYNFL